MCLDRCLFEEYVLSQSVQFLDPECTSVWWSFSALLVLNLSAQSQQLWTYLYLIFVLASIILSAQHTLCLLSAHRLRNCSTVSVAVAVAVGDWLIRDYSSTTQSRATHWKDHITKAANANPIILFWSWGPTPFSDQDVQCALEGRCWWRAQTHGTLDRGR